MNRPVVLPLTEARCPASRTVPCGLAATCARALVDGVGRYSQDYSIEARGPGNKCVHHLDASMFRPGATKAGPTSHEPEKGLS